MRLLSLVSISNIFKQLDASNKIKGRREQSPLSLLPLRTLKYLGRGWTFDDLEESIGTSEEVHRNFFHKFIKFRRKVSHPMF